MAGMSVGQSCKLAPAKCGSKVVKIALKFSLKCSKKERKHLKHFSDAREVWTGIKRCLKL